MRWLFLFAAFSVLALYLLSTKMNLFALRLYSSGPVITCLGEGEIKRGYDTVDGEIISHPFMENSQNRAIFGASSVPGEIGISFGFYACQVALQKSKTLTGVVTHPAMEFNGQTTTKQTWPIIIPSQWDQSNAQVCSIVGYTIEDDFEIVLGEWVFSLWEGDKLLLTETLELVKATEKSFNCSPI